MQDKPQDTRQPDQHDAPDSCHETQEAVFEHSPEAADNCTQLDRIEAQQRETLERLELSAQQVRRMGDRVGQAASAITNHGFRQLVEDLLRVVDLTDQLSGAAHMVGTQLRQLLQAHGVQVIPATGSPDYRLHRAVGVRDVDDSNQFKTILEVIRDGYCLGEIVIRPAEVIVGRSTNAPVMTGESDEIRN